MVCGVNEKVVLSRSGPDEEVVLGRGLYKKGRGP